MIGVYNYSVILTYLGVGLSLFGITQALSGNFDIAILCLALAGACDTFDGKVARSMKNRTEEQIIFGIQIDSLCDAICFGVTPAITNNGSYTYQNNASILSSKFSQACFLWGFRILRRSRTN